MRAGIQNSTMTLQKLNYDRIAAEYNQRYPSEAERKEVAQAVFALAQRTTNPHVLEAGVGTGRWLAALRSLTPHRFGLDFSLGMLKQSQARDSSLRLMRGSATRLPLESMRFDLVYCVDAIHHFVDTQAFVAEAFRLLKPGGTLAVIGADPHSGADEWYIYNYFESVLATDLTRYPSVPALRETMRTAGFAQIETEQIEHIFNEHHGSGVLTEPYIKQSSSSQLALLTDEIYNAGVEKIKTEISKAEARNEPLTFRTDLHVLMTTATKEN